MSKILFLLLMTICLTTAKAQIGIGTNTPNNTSILEIKDSTKGLLIPRMKMSGRTAIVNPAEGLLVYQTDNTKGFWFFDGSKWNSLSTTQHDSTGTAGFNTVSTTKNGLMIVVYTTTGAYGFTRTSSGNPSWYSQPLSGTVLGAVATDSSIVVYTSSSAYGFTQTSSGNPSWYSQPLSGTTLGGCASGNMIVVYTSTNAYGFTRESNGNPSWYSRPLSGTPLGAIGGAANGDNCIVVYTSSSAYGFTKTSSGNPSWYSQPLSGTTIGGSASGNIIVVYTSSSAYGFTRTSSGNPSWYSQPLSGTPVGIAPK